MEDAEEITYYELPPFFAQGIILPLYDLVDNISKIVPQLTCNPSFEEENAKLKARFKAEDNEFTLMMVIEPTANVRTVWKHILQLW